MARQNINIGTSAGDGTGDPIRTGGDKINDNFIEIYNQFTGGADYVDTTYTSGSPFSLLANTPVPVPNDAGTVEDSQLPTDLTIMYNPDLPNINFDAKTGVFTTGLTITGGTSGATAVIDSVTDNGADGTLFLKDILGEFIDNEIITDTSTGSATVDGTITAGKVLGKNGDRYLITLELVAKPTTNNATRLKFYFEIGLPLNQRLYRREFGLNKGLNVEHFPGFTQFYYTREEWERNGGILYVEATQPTDIYDIRFVLSRIHKAR